ncbi:NAD(P)H-hydrate dehydratase [Sphingomonas sp. TZW2008]|uniref:NAD(P)H-hydrate dehydratase n=1 Tax=Sphingomonas sp. TZW2008 TaxID=1917973 RepID=UPI0015C50B8D|nr:NAD(P)H-hydrate dehydratase [Sphingomonas sp. TZW2008]
MESIDARWRQANPLPTIGGGSDKDARGLTLVVGGSALTPGVTRLTAEAAFRAGSGKVRIGTLASVAAGVGIALPEAGMIALAEQDGEIGEAATTVLRPHIERCRALVIGCGMRRRPEVAVLLAASLASLGEQAVAVVDAGMLGVVGEAAAAVKRLRGRAILTPHPGELAGLLGVAKDAVTDDPVGAAADASARFGATVVLKAARTVLAADGHAQLDHWSDSPGLGTAGSGDVLAGIIGGLAARGAAPLVAAGWGVWLHGRAGAAAAAQIGPVGFIARELAGFVPAIMAAQSQR